MKRNSLFAAAIVLVIALVSAGVWWARSAEARDVAVSALPAKPDLAGWPQELKDRILEAEEDARSVFGARDGLAELARLYHASGFLGEAARCYQGLEWIEPGNARWPHCHAAILAGFGEISTALTLEKRAVSLAPDYMPARLRLGDLLLKSNQPAEAMAAYEAILRIKSDEPYAQLGLARVDFEAERWERARQRLEPLVSQTDGQLGYDLIVTVYERLGLPEKAALARSGGRASGAFRDGPDPWVDELLKDCYDTYRLGVAAGGAMRAGDSDTALALLERAVRLKPEDISSIFQLGMVHRDRKEFSSARMRFLECTRLAPDFADGWANLSALLTQLNDPVGAAKILADGLRACPESPGLHLMRARELALKGMRREAMESYRRSILYRSNEAAAFIELAGLLFEENRNEEGLAVMARALVAEPEHPSAITVMAFHAILTGDQAAARSWLARVRNQPRVPPERVARLEAAYLEKFGRAF